MTRDSDLHLAERVGASFERQTAMKLIRATLSLVEPGYAEIHVPHWGALSSGMASCMAALLACLPTRRPATPR